MNHASFRRDHVGNDHIIDRRFKPNVCGLEIESFKRSTIHGPFDTLTFKLLYKGEYILGYSGDTVADKELIDWLLEGGKHPIVHEVGSESPVCHTTPDELIELVPAEESSRVYYNHLIGRSEKKLKDAGFRPVNELKVI
jgi:ribonuclease BN (tRNA processing enzyme)